jgi:4-amino-4-deoxy-L-arabinose transferase-like glycosyltransferase
MTVETAGAPGARRIALLLLVATSLLFFWRLGDRSVVSEELRWAEIAREMRASGDYFHPTINGTTYYDKPVGSYWLIVAASHLTGEVNEMAARLPAAVCGVIGVWLTMLLGRWFYDDRVAVLAGAVLATSFGFTFYARRATADVETVAGVLAAVNLYAFRGNRGGPWVLALWLLMAATSLTKGLLGFALPIVVMGVDSCRIAIAKPDFRVADLVFANRWFFNRWTLIALPLGVAVYLLPFLMSAQPADSSLGLEMVWRENIQRFVSPHNHTGPIYLYAGVIFVLTAPWAAFLPAAFWPRQSPSRDGLVRVYFWALFAFFTLSASRRSYYLLPVLPAAALLIARVIAAPASELGLMGRRLRSLGWLAFAAVIAALGLGLLSPAWVLSSPYSELPPFPHREVLAVAWLVGLLALALAGMRLIRPESAAALAAFAAFVYVFCFALPGVEALRTRPAFLEEVRLRTEAAPEKLALLHARDVVFDLGRAAPEYTDVAALAADLKSGRVRWVLVRRRYFHEAALPAKIIAEEPAQPWEGLDQVGDKLLLLEAAGGDRS